MITLDRIKLVADMEHIRSFSPADFLKIPDRYGHFYYKYLHEHPYLLNIIINDRRNEIVIEFTGKILKDDYHRLINIDTIHQCLDTINHLGICELDVDGIVQSAEVCRCDVTMDVDCHYNMNDIKRHLKSSITNYDKWLYRNCENNGIEITKNFTSSKHRKLLILYEKGKELHKANNRYFMDWVSDRDSLERRFKSKMRFELNLRTKEQVRTFLHISDNKLNNVLSSTANPVLEVFDRAINENRTSTTTVYGKPDKMALLEQCGYDLQAVEMRIRATTPPTSSIGRKMEPYRTLLHEIQDVDEPMNIRNLIVG